MILTFGLFIFKLFGVYMGHLKPIIRAYGLSETFLVHELRGRPGTVRQTDRRTNEMQCMR